MVKSNYDERFEAWKAAKKRKEMLASRPTVVEKVEKEVGVIAKEIKKEEREHPKLFGAIKVLAWVLPILIILAVLYVNFSPFGFHKEYTITIGDDGSVISSSPQIYLQDMKGKMITNFTDVYNYGVVTLVLKPKVVLKNALVNASINGTDVYFGQTNFSVSDNSWDYFWDFTKGVLLGLNGTARFDKTKECVYFNGSLNQTLYYPNSSEMFENNSFIVYAKWKPEDPMGKNQQIVGHYNWELWQSNSSTQFMIGRLDNKNGTMPSISFPINESFFNKTHGAIAVYNADVNNSKGYMEFYVDGNFAGRKIITNSTIWAGYNGEKNLSSGWSSHNYGNNSYYTGCIYSVGFDYGEMSYLKNIEFNSSDQMVSIPIAGNGNFGKIKVSVEQ